MKRDLEIAKKRLTENHLSFSIVKEEKIIFESGSNGLKDLFEAVNKLGTSLINASIADQIVGKAAASLFVYSRANFVFAVTISEKGLKLLEQNHVSTEYLNIVPNVLNKERADLCPFEKMVLNCRDAKEAFSVLKNVFNQMG
jgi:iron complex outermembrane receptor protein/vitamin B12 transporter